LSFDLKNVGVNGCLCCRWVDYWVLLV